MKFTNLEDIFKQRKQEMLHFNDGISIDTSCELRILKLYDGYYVVGEGMLLPMDSYEECQEFIEKHIKQIK